MMRAPLSGIASGRAALGFMLLAVVSCTHDFSVFDVSGKSASDGSASGAPNGDAASGGAGGTDSGTSSTGGSGGSGGANAAGGAGGTPAAGGRGGVPDAGGVTDSGASGGSGGTSADAGPTPDDIACDSRYGAEPGYLRCAATATTCRFLYVSPTAVTCSSICGGRRPTCIDADNADPGSCAVTDATPTCATALTSAICVCGR